MNELIEQLDARINNATFDRMHILVTEWNELRRLALIGQQCLDAEPVAWACDQRKDEFSYKREKRPGAVLTYTKPLIPKPTV